MEEKKYTKEVTEYVCSDGYVTNIKSVAESHEYHLKRSKVIKEMPRMTLPGFRDFDTTWYMLANQEQLEVAVMEWDLPNKRTVIGDWVGRREYYDDYGGTDEEYVLLRDIIAEITSFLEAVKKSTEDNKV